MNFREQINRNRAKEGLEKSKFLLFFAQRMSQKLKKCPVRLITYQN